MPYSATIYQVLLSSPSDLPAQHKEIITNAMQIWNATTGRISKIHFSATDWKTGVNPTFGIHPQQVINDAIVDSSDLSIVVFTGKLGTPTDNFESGTVEEIERLFQAGKQVAVFVNRLSMPDAGVDQAKDKLKLEEFLESIRTKCFYKEYSTLEELTQSINALLQSTALSASANILQENKQIKHQETDLDNPSLGVWASIKNERYQETDNRGRLKTKTRSLLTLENLTSVPVRNVRYQFLQQDGQPDKLFDLVTGGELQPAGSLKPNGEAEFKILHVSASPNSSTCKVFWETPNGEEFTTETEIFI